MVYRCAVPGPLCRLVFLFTMSLFALPGCIFGPPEACELDLDAEELGVSQGVMGKVTIGGPASSSCEDGLVVDLYPLSEPIEHADDVRAVVDAAEGRIGATSTDGIYARELDAGDWLVCLENSGTLDLSCAVAVIEPDDVVQVDFAADDSGSFRAYNSEGSPDESWNVTR